jgi:lauroyl/myristoyl acyltransferase
MVDEPLPLRLRLPLSIITGGVSALGAARPAMAKGIGAAWWLAISDEARRRAARNHRRLDPSLSMRDAWLRARRSYIEYVSMILDAIWADRMSVDQLRPLIQVTGYEHMRRIEGGAVLAIAHFGNWDMAASGALAMGVPLTTVMAPIGPELTTELAMASRRRKGLELYTPDDAARGLLRALRRGRKVALMVDVPEAGPTVVVQYCGGPVEVSAVPARLAAVGRVPVLPSSCWRDGDGWRLCIYAPIESRRGMEQNVMQQVATVLEADVRRVPSQWYPFHEVYADGR